VDAIRMVDRAPAPLKPPRFEEVGELRFVGLSERTAYGEIENKTADIPVGITTGGEDGDLQYVCAAQVSRFGHVPKGLVKLTLAPATYAVFAHDDHITRLHRTYVTIWNDWFPASGKAPADAPGFERHNPTFDTRSGEGGVTIWIPLAPSRCVSSDC